MQKENEKVEKSILLTIIFPCYILSVLEFELRTSGILPLEPLHLPLFLLGIFEIGSRELFTWVGFEL
jgi:hypothetical protein